MSEQNFIAGPANESFNKITQEYLIQNGLPINNELIESVKKAYENISVQNYKYEMLSKYKKPTTPNYYLSRLKNTSRLLTEYENKLKNPIETKKRFFFFTVTIDHTKEIEYDIECFKNSIEYYKQNLEREIATSKRSVLLNKMELDIRNAVLEVKKTWWGYIEET